MKIRIIGMFLLFEALFQFIASCVALYYFYKWGEGDVVALTVSTIITAIFGFIFISAGRNNHKMPNREDIENLEMKEALV